MSMHKIRVLKWKDSSIIHLGSHYAGFDEDDPNITITFSSDRQIHAAMALPGHPANLTLGANPQQSKRNLIEWIDRIIKQNIVQMADVCDRDRSGKKMDGSYSGLRSGEWSRIVEDLTNSDMRAWQRSMDLAIPPLTCGKVKVGDVVAGRGNNTSSFPTIGPFLGVYN